MRGAFVFWKLPIDRSWKAALTSPLTVGTWFTVSVTLLGVGYAVLYPKPSQSSPIKTESLKNPSILELAKSGKCQTIVRDPNPPLNVRSSPVTAKDNVIGTLKNGTVLTVVNENEGWLQIDKPNRGWIYQDLTVTTCNTSGQTSNAPIAITAENHPASEAPVPDALPTTTEPIALSGDALLNAAQDRFQAGDLQGAIDRLKQVSSEDLNHSRAKSLLKQMPEDWRAALSTYHEAEAAIQSRRPHVVLSLVEKIPDIRYWRAKMTPLVKQAIAQQQGQL